MHEDNNPQERTSDRSGSPSVPSNGNFADINLRTAQLDEIEYILCNFVTNHRLAPLTRNGHLDGGFHFHAVQELGIFNVHFGRPLAAHLGPEIMDDRLAFAIAAKGSTRFLLGRNEFHALGPMGLVIYSGPRRILHFSEDSETQVLVMNRSNIVRCCAKLLGHEIEGQVEFETLFPLDTTAGRSWLRLFQYASSELSDPRSLVRTVPAAWVQLEQMVITGFLLAHAHNYTDALHRPQSAAVPFYVKRAEAYIEAHFAEPVSLADIAANAGVSARSLQNGFQNFRGMTPMAFLRSVRLRHAHHALKVADPAAATVTEVALLCGFGHMGEFATLYKRTFGVTPRQTLTKAA